MKYVHKSALIKAAAWAVCALTTYGLFCFITLELNPLHWSIVFRACYVFFCTAIVLFIYSIEA